jgi:hypothetical protein
MTMTWLLMWALAAAPVAAPEAKREAKAEAPAPAKKGASKKQAGKQSKSKQAAAPPAPVAPAPVEEAEAPPPPMYRWSVPQQLDYVASIGVQVTDGVPMVLEMARSSMPVDLLIQHYVDDFQAAGLFIPPLDVQASPMAEPRLTALDPERLVAYTVIFQPNPDRTTTLYLGTADMKQYRPPGGANLEWAPMMPGAEKLMRTELEGMQSAVYAVRASEADVLAFYRQALGAQGYTEAEPGTFQRGQEELRVFSNPTDDGGRSVGLTRKVGGARAPTP